MHVPRSSYMYHVLQGSCFLTVEARGSGGALPPQGSRGVWGAASPPMADSVLGEPSSDPGGTGSPVPRYTIP